MPLIAGTLVRPPGVNPISPLELTAAWWLAPDGTRWNLTDWSANWFTMPGVKGTGAATYTLTADDMPRGGTRLRTPHANNRLITWPLYVEGVDLRQPSFMANWRALGNAFAQTMRRGGQPGTLVVAQPDGSLRQIQAVYQDGWDPSGDPGTGMWWDHVVLTLYAPRPYWSAPTPIRVERRQQPSGVQFLSPYPTLSSSQTLGDTTVTNPGDVQSWGDWTITGPCSLFTAQHLDTGRIFKLDPTLATAGGVPLGAGETVTITGDPPRVIGPDGSTWAKALVWPDAADLWPLEPGDNRVHFQLDGAEDGAGVELSFYPLYEMA